MWSVLRLKALLEPCVAALLKRGMFLAVLNVLFFSLVLAGAFVARWTDVVFYDLSSSRSVLDVGANPLLLAVGIFLFNLVMSGFLLTTFSGLVFFGVPLLVLVWRALSWGALTAQLPSPQFFVALPTFVLEGEAYVIAAVAGVLLGLSWLKPAWVARGQKMTRLGALRAALAECVRFYFWVVLLLIIGAVVEAVTLVYLC